MRLIVKLLGLGIIMASLSCTSKKNDVSKLDFDEISFENIDSLTIIRSVDTGHLAFPDICSDNQGKIFLVYREGRGHVEETGKICLQWSSDFGLSWSTPINIIDSPNIDDRDPSISFGSDEMLHLVFFKYVKNHGSTLPRAISQVYYSIGNPSNFNFTEAVRIGNDSLILEYATINENNLWTYEDGTRIITRGISSKSIEHSSKWYIPVYGGHPAVTDSIGNWISPASRVSLFVKDEQVVEEISINPNEMSDVWLQEPCLLIIHDSLWVMQIRTAEGSKPFNKGYLMQSTSTNQGASWASWESLDFIGHAPFLFKCSSGIIISAFRLLNDDYDRAATAFMWSTDSCKTWSKPQLLEEAADWDCSYPSICEIGKDTLLFVFYSENGTKIKSSTYRISYK